MLEGTYVKLHSHTAVGAHSAIKYLFKQFCPKNMGLFFTALFKSLNVQLEFSTKEKEAIQEFLLKLGVSSEVLSMVPYILSQILAGVGSKDEIKLLDGKISGYVGNGNSAIELCIELNGIKEVAELIGMK